MAGSGSNFPTAKIPKVVPRLTQCSVSYAGTRLKVHGDPRRAPSNSKTGNLVQSGSEFCVAANSECRCYCQVVEVATQSECSVHTIVTDEVIKRQLTALSDSQPPLSCPPSETHSVEQSKNIVLSEVPPESVVLCC